MKGLFVVLLIFSLAAFAAGLGEVKVSRLDPIKQLPTKKIGADPAWCPTCVTFMGEAISDILNEILNEGVLGSCAALCVLIPLGPVEIAVCNILCDIIGIEAFIKLVNITDPDPVWFCMELDVCPISDNASASILSLTVTPASGPQGTTFTITTIYRVNSTIATGEIEFIIIPPDAIPFGTGGLIVMQTPAMYKAELQFQANPSENEPFNPGTYQAAVGLCEGACGSIHSHSYTLAEQVTSFKITQ